jgi:uncharacterized linocin/CFP29 family protein
MAEWHMRDDAPLSSEEWRQLDETVVTAARRVLVGRRFINLAGPFGVGTQVLPLDTIEGTEACTHPEAAAGCAGGECDVLHVGARRFLPFVLIHKDFSLSWQDIESAHQFNMKLEFGPAAAAATLVAAAEDRMIFEGLLSAEGRQSLPLSDWATSGNALNDVIAASQQLADCGFYPPYVLLVGSVLYGMLQRVYNGSGHQEYELVASVADGGIFRSPFLPPGKAILVSQGPHNLDLAIAQDIITAYLGPDGLDHRFRVLESVVLRIKRPGAICVLE